MEIAPSWPLSLRVPLKYCFHTSCVCKIAMASTLQYLTMHLFRLIGVLDYATQVYSPKTNWYAIWACGIYLWYKHGWFYLSRLFPQKLIIFYSLDNAYIIQMHIISKIHLIHVKCGAIQSHVLGGFQIHIMFAHILGMCFSAHYKCVIVNVLYILRIFSLIFLFYSKNKQCRMVCRNRNMIFYIGSKMNSCLCFATTPWHHLQLKALSYYVLTSCSSNAVLCIPS